MNLRPSSPEPARRPTSPRTALRTYLIAIMLVATVPMALFMSAVIASEFARQRDEQRTVVEMMARRAANAVDREVRDSIGTLQALARFDVLQRGDAAAARDAVLSAAALLPAWNGIVLFDADGRVLAGGFEPRASLDDAALRSRLAGGAATVSTVGDERGADAVVFVPVLSSADGALRYVVAARIAASAWRSVIEASLREGTPFSLEVASPPRRIAASGTPGAADPDDRVRQIVACCGWTIDVGPASTGMGAAQTSTLLGIVGAATACLLLGLGAATLIARRVTEPLERIANQPESAADSSSVAEIAALGEALRRSTAARLRLLGQERRARRHAQLADRAKDELLDMLAHDLRNPLNAIATAIEVLGIDGAPQALALRARQIIAEETRRIAQTINAMLDAGQLVASDPSLAMRPLDLASIVCASVNAVRGRALAAGRSVESLVGADAWVMGDAHRLRQVVDHLLDGALRDATDGDDKRIRVVLRIDAGWVTLRVSEGDGEAVSRTLRASSRRGGSAIGDALVRRIVALHGGEIPSDPAGVVAGSGPVPDLRLPAMTRPVAADEDSDAQAAELPG